MLGSKQEGIPKLFYSGGEGNYNILVIEYLGKSLDKLMEYCDGNFSIFTTVELAIQMVLVH